MLQGQAMEHFTTFTDYSNETSRQLKQENKFERA